MLAYILLYFKRLFQSFPRAFVFTSRKTEILSVNFPKTMFNIQNHFGYDAVTKEKTIYKFKINFDVLFHILLFRIITSCNGHYAPMGSQQ